MAASGGRSSSRPASGMSVGIPRIGRGGSRMVSDVSATDSWMQEIDETRRKGQVVDEPTAAGGLRSTGPTRGRRRPSGEIRDLIAFESDYDWVLDVIRQFESAGQKGAQEIKDAQMRAFLASVAEHSGEGPAQQNSASEDQVLPHGWWRLKVTVMCARDMEKQQPPQLGMSPEVNPFVELSVGNGKVFRTRVVPNDQLRQTEEEGKVHNTVATFRNESVVFTLNNDWFKTPLTVKLYHWRPVDHFTSQTDKYLTFDSYGIPTHVLNGTKISDRGREQLTAEIGTKTEPILLAYVDLSLEWYRQKFKAGWINLKSSNGRLDPRRFASVLMKLEPTVPRPKTAAEMKELTRVNLRRQYAARAAEALSPVPSAIPFKPPQSSWGRPASRSGGQLAGDDERTDAGARQTTDGDPVPPMQNSALSVGQEGIVQVLAIQGAEEGSQTVAGESGGVQQDSGQPQEFSLTTNTEKHGASEEASREQAHIPDQPHSPEAERTTIKNKSRRLLENPDHMKFAPKSSAFEWNGLLGWLATDGGRTSHLNPADRGLIRLSASSPWVWGRVENVVDQAPKPSASPSEKSGWMCIELRKGLKLSPTHYSMRHGLVGSGRVLRNWRLLGSANGSEWVCLRDHAEDGSILSAAAVTSDPLKDAPGLLRPSDFPRAPAMPDNTGFSGQATYTLLEIEEPTKTFPSPEELQQLEEKRRRVASLMSTIVKLGGLRFFRIELTGPDTSGSHCICLSGLELYGQAHLDWDILLQGIKRSESDRRLEVCRLLRAVAKRGHVHAIAAAQELLRDENEDVALEAQGALAVLGKPPGPVHFLPTLEAPCTTYFLWQGEPCPTLRVVASGTSPLRFSSEPALPAGLTLDAVSGEISGAPITPQDCSLFEITCSSCSGESTAQLYLEILPIPVAVGASFRFESDYDGLGLIHFLGTSGGKAQRSNPGLTGAVRLDSSGWLTDVHHEHLWLLPTRYSLMHGHGSASHALRNWELLGSSDGQSWTVLRAHELDESLSGRFASCTWSVGQSGPLRMFKVRMTGLNSTYRKDMRICGFEIYGKVLIGRPARALESPLWFIRVWALDALLRGLELQRQIADLSGTSLSAADAISRMDSMGFECGSLKEKLILLLGDDDSDVRRASLSMMPLVSARGEVETLQSIVKCLGDTDDLVRQTAVLAITALVEPGENRGMVVALLDAAFEEWLTGQQASGRMSTASSQRWPLGATPAGSTGTGPRSCNGMSEVLRERAVTASDAIIPSEQASHGRRVGSAGVREGHWDGKSTSLEQGLFPRNTETPTSAGQESGPRSRSAGLLGLQPGLSLKDAIIPPVEDRSAADRRRRRTQEGLQRAKSGPGSDLAVTFANDLAPSGEGVAMSERSEVEGALVPRYPAVERVSAGVGTSEAGEGMDRGPSLSTGGKTPSRRGVTFLEREQEDLEPPAAMPGSMGASSRGGTAASASRGTSSRGGLSRRTSADIAFFDDEHDEGDHELADKSRSFSGQDPMIEGLIAAAGSEEGGDALRQVFAAGISSYGRRQWQPFVLPNTKHSTWFVRLAAVRVLSVLAANGDDEAIGSAIELSRDSEVLVRRQAAKALGLLSKSGNEFVKEHLVSLLGDEDAEVRRELSSSLATLAAVPTMYHSNQRLDSAPTMANSTIALARHVAGAPLRRGSIGMSTPASRQRRPLEMELPDAPRPPTAVRSALVDSFMKLQEQSVQQSAFPRLNPQPDDPHQASQKGRRQGRSVHKELRVLSPGLIWARGPGSPLT